jgi:RND family efflux transporter MFP subunit
LRRWLIRIVVGLVVVVGAGFGWQHFRQPLVVVGSPVRGPAVEAVYATGIVEPVTWAKVQPLVTARVVELCKCEGRPVDRGDVLVRLDDAGAAAHVDELTARVAFLEKEAERYRRLIGERIVSLQTYERVTSDLGQAMAALGVARERLADYTLRAPMSGIVLRRDGEVGEIVAPGDVVFWVGQPKPLWIVADVDEEDIPRVRADQRALIKADAFPGQVLDGRVERITPKGDPVNKSFRVYVALPDDTPLMIGMTTEVNLVVATTDDALLVPAEAVRDGRVFVLQGDRAIARPVELGTVGDRMIEIRGGLADNEPILLAPPADLADRARVRIAGSDGRR